MAKTNVERLTLELAKYNCALFHSTEDNKWKVIYAPSPHHKVMPVAAGFNLSEVLVNAHAVMRVAQRDFDAKEGKVEVEVRPEVEEAGSAE